MYIDTITDYLNVCKALCDCKDYSSAYDILTEFKPKALSRKKIKMSVMICVTLQKNTEMKLKIP